MCVTSLDVKEQERQHYPMLRSYIQAVVVPEMPVTNCLSAVRDFIKDVNGDTYF